MIDTALALSLKFKGIATAVALYGGFAIVGGVLRVLMGLTEKDCLKTEIYMHLFAAMPVGILCGWGVGSFNTPEFLPYAAAFLGGTSAINITRQITKVGIQGLINYILRGGR